MTFFPSPSTDIDNSMIPTVCSSCVESTSQKECLGSRSCLWCENVRRCFDERLYLVHFPYGQCFEWTSNNIKGTHKGKYVHFQDSETVDL